MNPAHPPLPAQNDALHFAPLAGGRQLLLTTTAKAVSPFAGLASFIAWLRQVGLLDQASRALPFSYASPNAIPITHTFTAFLLSVVVGASRFAHCDWLRFDSALHSLLGFKRFPSDDAVLRFFARFTQGYVEAFFRPLFRWLLALLKQPPEGFTLDLDSTVFAREGSQEGAAKGYNPQRPGRKCHHPLLAVLAEAPFVLHAWLRSGNASSGRGVCAFLKEAFAQLPTGWRLRCLRADSGFFDQALLAMLEEHAVPYIIVARMTTALKRRINSAALVWRDLGKGYAASSFTLKLYGWSDTRRFVVVRELEREDKSAVGRRLIDVPGYTFRVWVTNRTDDAATLWRDYNGRATIEQRIEELKNDMHADGFCTRKFFATEAAMLSAIFAYNLLAVYQGQVTPQSGWRRPATLRAAVFVCGAILGRIGHKLVLRVSRVGGGMAKHKALIDKACGPPEPIAPLLPRTRRLPPDWDIVAPGGCMI